MQYYSQIQQDKIIDDYLKQKQNGFFIEIGAHNGIDGSNTAFFEKFRNWKGICIEPGPNEFKKLTENRTSININACVSNYNGESNFVYIDGYSMMLSGLLENYNQAHVNRINSEVHQYGGTVKQLKVPVKTLQSILDEHLITEVDYCSIDTEGSEFEIVSSIDYDKTNIKIFSIENNYGETKIQQFLKSKGYTLAMKAQWDDIFIKI